MEAKFELLFTKEFLRTFSPVSNLENCHDIQFLFFLLILLHQSVTWYT